MRWKFNFRDGSLMPVCEALQVPLLPNIPKIFLPGGSLVIPINIGKLGVTCCYYQVPPIAIPLGITIPNVATLLMAAIGPIEAAINAALSELDQIQIPGCTLS